MCLDMRILHDLFLSRLLLILKVSSEFKGFPPKIKKIIYVDYFRLKQVDYKITEMQE